MNLIKRCKIFSKFIFSKIYIMNKNNIFNFVKYAIFAGILYFIMKKIPAINIKEYEILMLIVIIGAGLYSYECLIEGYKFGNQSWNLMCNKQFHLDDYFLNMNILCLIEIFDVIRYVRVLM